MFRRAEQRFCLGLRKPVGVLLLLLLLVLPLLSQEKKAGVEAHGKAGDLHEPGAVEARLLDGSALRLHLREKAIELTSPYGKLRVPVEEIQRIEFATRVPEDILRKVETAIAHLSDREFSVREKATAELLRLRERAYPALIHAAQSKELEVVRRAEELIDKIRELVPESALIVREYDVIHTAHSKLSGKIEAPTLHVETASFGQLQLKLADARSLRSLNFPEEPDVDVAKADNDPGNLMQYVNQIGKTFRFRVTGAGAPVAAGPAVGIFGIGGSLWGTDTYTADSTLALAAVHAGVLKPGQSGMVRVKMVASPPSFEGSTRNGVTSSGFGIFPAAYKVMR